MPHDPYKGHPPVAPEITGAPGLRFPSGLPVPAEWEFPDGGPPPAAVMPPPVSPEVQGVPEGVPAVEPEPAPEEALAVAEAFGLPEPTPGFRPGELDLGEALAPPPAQTFEGDAGQLDFYRGEGATLPEEPAPEPTTPVGDVVASAQQQAEDSVGGPTAGERMEDLNDVGAVLERDRRQRVTDAARRAEARRVQREHEEAQEQIRQKYEADRARRSEEFARLGQEARELAEQEVDPDRWWADRSTGQKIAGVLSAVIGGLVAPHQGGRNRGLEAIQQAIQQDIEAQRATLGNRQRALSQERGLVADLMRKGYNEFQASTIAEQAAYKRAIDELELMQQELDPGGVAAADAELTKRGLYGAMAQRAAEAEQRAKEAAREQEMHDAELAKLGAETEYKRAQVGKVQAEAAKARRAGVGGRKAAEEAVAKGMLIDPETGQSLGKLRDDFSSASAVREQQAKVTSYTTSRQKLNEIMRGMRKGAGDWGKLPDTEKARLTSVYRDFIAEYVKSISGAAVTNEERAFYMSAIPGPKDLFTMDFSDRTKVLEDVARRQDEAVQRQLVGAGIDPQEAQAFTRRIGTLGRIGVESPGYRSTEEVGLEIEAAIEKGDPDKIREASEALIENLKTGNLTEHRRRDAERVAKTLSQIPEEQRTYLAPNASGTLRRVDPMEELSVFLTEGTPEERERRREEQEEERRRREVERKAREAQYRGVGR